MGKGSVTVGYRYYFTIHMGISRGPVDQLVTVQVGGKTAWPRSYETNYGGGCEYKFNPETDSMSYVCQPEVWSTYPADLPARETKQIRIHAPDLFGGDEAEGGIEGDMWVLMGEPDQVAPSILSSMLGGLVSGFRGMFTLVYDGLVASLNPYPKPWRFRVRRALKGWNGPVFLPDKAVIMLLGPESTEDPESILSDTDRNIYAMNAAHIIYECLTNPEWGRGETPDLIDEGSFEYVANQLCCEGFGLCLRWMRQDDVTSFIQGVLDHIGAVLFPSKATGLITLRLIREDYLVESLPVYTTANGILNIVEDESSTATTLYNEVVVSYIDPVTGEARQTRVHNIGAMQAAGSIFSKSSDYPGIPTAELASRVAQRDLRVLGTPLRRFKIEFDRRGWQIEPGAVLRIQAPDRNIADMVLRVGKIEDKENSGIVITAVEDIFGLPSTALVGFVPPVPGQSGDPIPATVQAIYEASRVDVLRATTESELALVTNDDSFAFLLGERPSPFAINFRTYTSAGPNDYSGKGLGDWSPTGTLASAIQPLSSSVVLDNLTLASRITVGDAAIIDNEVVQVSSWDAVTSTLGILRGCMDTVPVAHAQDAVIWFYYQGLGADPTKYATGEDIYGKILTRTSSGTLHYSLATAMNRVLVGRHARPYPPGNLRINGQSFPDVTAVDPGFTMTWVGRNRLTQGDVLVSHKAAGVNPEAGTTYNVRIRRASNNSIVREATGITGNGWSYPNSQWMADGSVINNIVELESQRDGLTSYQKYSFPLTIIPETGWGTQWGYNWGGAAPPPPPQAPSFYTAIDQTAEDTRDGNHAILFMDWTGYQLNANPQTDDSYWGPPGAPTDLKSFYLHIYKTADTPGDPAPYSLGPKATLANNEGGSLPEHIRRANDQTLFTTGGISGDQSLSQIVASPHPLNGQLYAVQRNAGNTGVYPSDWSDNFYSTPEGGYDRAIIFPKGERVRIQHDINTPIYAGPGEWVILAYSLPADRNSQWVGTTICNMDLGSNFLEKITAPRPQKSVFYVENVPDFSVRHVYTVTLEGVNFTYTSTISDTEVSILNALASLIGAHADYTTEVIGNAFSAQGLIVTGQPNQPFTVSASITPYVQPPIKRAFFWYDHATNTSVHADTVNEYYTLAQGFSVVGPVTRGAPAGRFFASIGQDDLYGRYYTYYVGQSGADARVLMNPQPTGISGYFTGAGNRTPAAVAHDPDTDEYLLLSYNADGSLAKEHRWDAAGGSESVVDATVGGIVSQPPPGTAYQFYPWILAKFLGQWRAFTYGYGFAFYFKRHASNPDWTQYNPNQWGVPTLSGYGQHVVGADVISSGTVLVALVDSIFAGSNPQTHYLQALRTTDGENWAQVGGLVLMNNAGGLATTSGEVGAVVYAGNPYSSRLVRIGSSVGYYFHTTAEGGQGPGMYLMKSNADGTAWTMHKVDISGASSSQVLSGICGNADGSAVLAQYYTRLGFSDASATMVKSTDGINFTAIPDSAVWVTGFADQSGDHKAVPGSLIGDVRVPILSSGSKFLFERRVQQD